MWIWASNSMVSIMFKSPLGTFESVLFYGRSVVIWISIVLEKYTLSHCWCQHYSFKGLVPACVVGHMRILGGIRIWKSIWTPWGPNRKEKRQTILFWLYVQFKAPLKFPFLNVDRSLLHIVGSRAPYKIWASSTTPFKIDCLERWSHNIIQIHKNVMQECQYSAKYSPYSIWMMEYST